MADFPGYVIVEGPEETLYFHVYTARQRERNEQVVIKALKIEQTTPEEIARFTHECEMIRELSPDGIIRILDIIDTGNTVALVLEDFDGIPLKEIIRGGLPIERFLQLAVRLAEILGKLHQHNITHRDVKPQSIIINPENDIVKITDFGIAAEITRINEEIYTPRVIEGALAYMSPEQTHRMNCSVDYRTDLYSLGVTFYEMLTGEKPFQSNDPLELIHAHIAQLPVRPENLRPDIPPPVSDIIMKLMSKAAIERYQNSFGLQADLQECLRILHATGVIEAFALGRQDIPLKFSIPQMVVGRDAELSTLLSAFERVSLGSVELVLVTGEPGIGKTALVGEIHKPIVEKRGYFISGKYDRFRQDVPYRSIIQAFQELCRQILTESEERLQQWRAKIMQAVGPNGWIITDAIPEFEHIIGQQPALPELSPEETQNRLNHVIKNFVRIFAQPEHPLVVFLDDLQWADSASINLIRTIITDSEQHCLLLIGAYRSNEVAEHHPLMLTLGLLKKAGVHISTMTLGALDAAEVNQLNSAFLRCHVDDSRELSNSIHGKTGGNPFFIKQFIQRLYESHLIVLEAGKGWRWDLQQIQGLTVTDNVVDFMAGKLRDLPATILELIQISACIGNRFDAGSLSILGQRSMSETISALDTLIQEGLIERRGDLYHFHHDRIQEAAYALLSPDQRTRMHYQIGTLIWRHTTPENFDDRLFAIVDHMNRAKIMISNQTERTALAELNAQAGVKAKKFSAYKPAVRYLREGLALLPDDAWQSNYQLNYLLHKELVECEYLDRNFEEAEKRFEAILSHARSRSEMADLYTSMVILYTDTRSAVDGINLGLKALKLFDIHIPITMGPVPVLRELLKVKWALRKIPWSQIPQLPPMEDQERKAILHLMSTIGTPAYYVNTNVFAYIALYAVRAALKYGHTPNSSVAFAALAIIIQIVHGDYASGYRLGELALQLDARHDKNPLVAGLVPHVFAFFIQHWRKHARYDIDIFRTVYQTALNAGNYIYAGLSVVAAAEYRLMMGDRLDDVSDDLQQYQGLMQIIKDKVVLDHYLEKNRLIKTLKGLTPHRYSMDGDGFDHDRQIEKLKREQNYFGLCGSQLAKLRLLYLYGRYEEARQTAAELDTHIKFRIGTLYVSEHYFYYSLILTALVLEGERKHRIRYRRLIARNQSKLKKFSGLCPDNFLHKYHLIQAELAAIDGHLQDALHFYHAAIQGARQNEYLHEEALACERAAHFYLRLQAQEEARTFMRMARDCYTRWGAIAKRKDLHEHYPDLLVDEISNHIPQSLSNTSAPSFASHLLDLNTVMEVSQVISSEIMLDKLLEKIMHLSIANAGAQRGYLLLESDGTLMVAASQDVDSGASRVFQPLPLEDCQGLSHAMVHYVSRSTKTLILGNAMDEGAFMNDPHIQHNHCKSILCMPILNKGKLTGILYMENNLTADAFTRERLEILHIISAQAAISLENARLFDLATTDGLTKLFVRRYFLLKLEQEIQRSHRNNRPFALAMFDIDNFKKCNDTYGHQFGDEVLRSVAASIRKDIRAVDIAARYGGEEFVVIFPETTLDQATIAAEKIRSSIARTDIPYEGRMVRVTVSIGLSEYPQHAQDRETLIKCADEGLYTAKRNGKNQVCVGALSKAGDPYP